MSQSVQVVAGVGWGKKGGGGGGGGGSERG